MNELKPFEIDGAKEKHIPVYEIENNSLKVKVGEVDHPMEEDHFIEFIAYECENMILRYIRNNKDSDFVQNTLLKDEDSLKVIESYNYVDLSTYTLCNVLSVDNGVNFYHDYSKIMTSTTNVSKVQETDENGNPLFKEITRTDSMGLEYIEYKPIYKINDSGTYYYNYTIQRIPMIRAEFLDTEASMQDFILSIEERRKYIEECLLLLEDTFGIDLKFVNTFGPSRRFYYNIPTSQNYDVKVITKSINVYSNLETEEIVGTIPFGTIVSIHKVNGLWGYITNPLEGWIRLADTNKCITYMDNVALILKFSMEVMSSADRAIVSSIVADIKNYIENIDSIIELHMPNIITLITNNYREQLKYFEFRGVNQYSSDCQHIYLDTTINADIPPEFLNVATDCDSNNTPRVDITTF
jgi:superoxide reductase